MLCGTLAGVEMGLVAAGVPHRKGGVQAALDFLAAGKTEATLPAIARKPPRVASRV